MCKVVGLVLSILLLGQTQALESDSFDLETSQAVDAASQVLQDNILEAIRYDPARRLRDGGWNVVEANLSDIGFNHFDNDISFKNVVLKGMSQVQAEDIKPNLEDQSLEYTVRYHSIVIEGTYEDSSERSQNIFINLENVKVGGLAGLAFEGSTPVIRNIKMDFLENEVNVLDAETQEQVHSIPSAVVDQILDTLKNEIAQHIQQNLIQFLNSVLFQNSLEHLFGNNEAVVGRYRAAISGRDNKVNQVVDYILALVTQYFKESGYDKVAIPEIHETYKKKIGFFKVKASFDATNGFVRDPTTLHRTGDFSIKGSWDGPEFELYGSLGFSKLQGKYDHYRAKFIGIKVSGHVEANINKNSVFFSIKAKYVNPELIHINSYEVKIEKFDDIKVKANGLGSALNWLYSKALTAVAKHMKGKVVKEIETSARRVIDKKLNAMSWNIPIKF